MRVPRARRFRTTKLRDSCCDEDPKRVEADALKTSEREAGSRTKSITFEREEREVRETNRGTEGSFNNASPKDSPQEP